MPTPGANDYDAIKRLAKGLGYNFLQQRSPDDLELPGLLFTTLTIDSLSDIRASFVTNARKERFSKPVTFTLYELTTLGGGSLKTH